jgi:pimeloyl-ACP methyl ester carboxylesterase
MTSTKPTIVWVPGAWHIPSHYKLTTDILSKLGYKVVVVRLPSTRQTAPYPKDSGMDVGAVASAILTELDERNEIIVVMHSYGGLVGSDAVQGLSKNDREKKGLEGGVTKLVYLTSMAFPEGWDTGSLREATTNIPGNVRRQNFEGDSDVSESSAMTGECVTSNAEI